jgi:hypothetical protein
MTRADGSSYQIHVEARGPHWISWISTDGTATPYRSVVLIAKTEEQARARAELWAQQPG